MPQMNPMNWLFLFMYFNLILITVGVKVNFMFKEGSMAVETFKDVSGASWFLFQL